MFVGASCGGASEIALQAAEACGFRCKNLIGRTSFQELIHLLNCTKGALCVDSLVAHLAIANRIPTLVLMMEPFSDRRFFPAATAIPQVFFGSGREQRLASEADVAGAFIKLCWKKRC